MTRTAHRLGQVRELRSAMELARRLAEAKVLMERRQLDEAKRQRESRQTRSERTAQGWRALLNSSRFDLLVAQSLAQAVREDGHALIEAQQAERGADERHGDAVCKMDHARRRAEAGKALFRKVKRAQSREAEEVQLAAAEDLRFARRGIR